MALTSQFDLQDEIASLMDRVFEAPFFNESPLSRLALSAPPLDLYQKNGSYVIELAVPGYDAKEINAEVNASTVTITGSRAETAEKKEAKYYRKEMRKGAFSRTVTLPQDIDPEKVQAKVEKGVLTVTLTPLKPIAAKRVAIQGEA